MCFVLEFHTDSWPYPLDRLMVGDYVYSLGTCLVALLIAFLAEEKHFNLTQSDLPVKPFSYGFIYFFLDGVNSCNKIKYYVSFSI